MRKRLTVLLTMLAAACETGGADDGDADESSESTGGELDACETITGHTYRSVEELECGLTPNGPDLCPWTIEFGDTGHFTWFLSDFQESGSYYCNGLTVHGSGSTMSYQGSLDPQTGVLSWDGNDYTLVEG